MVAFVFVLRPLSIHFCKVDDVLMEQRPADYGGMKTYLKKTYDRVEK